MKNFTILSKFVTLANKGDSNCQLRIEDNYLEK